VLTVRVLVPEPVIDDGLKLAPAPAGRLEAARPTVPLNPLTGVTVKV
jgi:hypothetical protein